MKEKINQAFANMAEAIEDHRSELLEANAQDVAQCDASDIALYDRLHLDDNKIDGMVDSLNQLAAKPSPIGQVQYTFRHDNGLQIENRSVPFGNILIVYESRPDVTVEATATALKSGNHILLKGGKEAKASNLLLHGLWEEALEAAGISKDYVRYLNMNRQEFQQYLKHPDVPIDLIIPRGGERLIEYVKEVANCPVLISGRGNNFLYVAASADLEMAKDLIIQSKLGKISACNALDKVLIDQKVPISFFNELQQKLMDLGVEVVLEPDDAIWKEEFLDKKIVLHVVDDMAQAIQIINAHSGGHSAAIVTSDEAEAEDFMLEVDSAAVYHNASTRFTDGFQFGLGAEMAISTDKLHHRGPLGVEHLVTNKWFVKGNGQTR